MASRITATPPVRVGTADLQFVATTESHRASLSRVYVVRDADHPDRQAAGYYALAAGSVAPADAYLRLRQSVGGYHLLRESRLVVVEFATFARWRPVRCPIAVGSETRPR